MHRERGAGGGTIFCLFVCNKCVHTLASQFSSSTFLVLFLLCSPQSTCHPKSVSTATANVARKKSIFTKINSCFLCDIYDTKRNQFVIFDRAEPNRNIRIWHINFSTILAIEIGWSNIIIRNQNFHILSFSFCVSLFLSFPFYSILLFIQFFGFASVHSLSLVLCLPTTTYTLQIKHFNIWQGRWNAALFRVALALTLALTSSHCVIW